MSGLEVELRNFKVIAAANVALPGITVLAGPNGSGKTTFAKFLYHFIDTNMNFQARISIQTLDIISDVIKVVARDFRNNSVTNIKSVEDAVQQLLSRLDKFSGPEILGVTDRDFDTHLDELVTVLNYIKSSLVDRELSPSVINGLLRIFPDIEGNSKDLHTSQVIMVQVQERLRIEIDKLAYKMLGRSINDFNTLLHRALELRNVNFQYNVKLDSTSLLNADRFEFLHGTFDQIIYLESYILPVDIEQNKNQLDALGKLLTRKNDKFIPVDNEIDKEFNSKQILDGQIVIDSFGIKYQTAHGVFPIDECASGVKMLAILYLLYKNGHLNKYTVLIIEEPEAHLHPQWIVEFARLLILIQKKVGVTFLITSHSPTLVRAMKYIAEKELKQPERFIRFYLSEQSVSAPGKYNIVDKGFKINDIMASFNLAIDRVNDYADRDD